MDLLDANVAALNEVDSVLLSRIRETVSVPHLEHNDAGQLVLRIHRTRVNLSLPPASIELVLSRAEEKGAPPRVLLFGVGLGSLLDAALKRWPDAEVVAWERDPVLMGHALARVDVSDGVRAGRLRLLLGSDLLELDAEWRQEVSEPGKPSEERERGVAPLVHPILKQFYWREWDYLVGQPHRPIAAICAGTLFVDDLSEALMSQGYATWTLDLKGLSVAAIDREIERVQPQHVWSINYTLGLANLCARHDCPLMVWEIDPSIETIQSVQEDSRTSHLFTWCGAHVNHWQKVGFESTHYLPLAANPERRTPMNLTRAETDRYTADVCFVGSSMLGQVVEFRNQLRTSIGDWLRRNGRDPQHAGTLIEAMLAHQRADLRRYVIPDLVEGAMPGFLAEMKALGTRFDPVMLLGELAAAERRLSVVASMGDMGIEVWGDAGWRAVQKHGVRFRGSAGHLEELNRIYNAARIHVDIGRVYQLDIVTMRVFDVISCGGFVLADRNAAVLELFEDGVEIETWITVEELKRKCQYYLAHPEQAREIAARGRARLLREHRIVDRVQEMLKRAGALDSLDRRE